MKTAEHSQEPAAASRPLSIAEVLAEASRHLEQGETELALTLLERTVRHAPHLPVLRHLLGVAQGRQKQRQLAIPDLQQALRADESNIEYLLSLGEALMAEQPLEAILHLARAVELGSRNPDAYSKLAGLLLDSRKTEDALDICDRGLAVCGGDPEILRNRGLALQALSRYEESLECLLRVQKLLPRDYRAMVDLGNLLRDLGRLDESRKYLERACALDPGGASARYSLGLTRLVAGDYREGFREYEWRWGNPHSTGRPEFPQPLWDGSKLEGRRILLHSPEGSEDTIQFARYAKFVRDRGGSVTLRVAAPLVRLIGWLADCEVATPNITTTAGAFDVQCPLLSLPRLAATDRDSIPPPAQFAIPPEMQRKWSVLLGKKIGPRVGIAWTSSQRQPGDPTRSLACGLLAPLLEVPGVEWFSLQPGAAADQLAESDIQGRIRNLAPELTDFAETAAAISELDLVITIDSPVAHLAGSLGIAVWMLTPFAPDWRWLRERSDSPWYPSMRLYRQQAAGQWESVVHSVAADLSRWILSELAGAPAPRPRPVHDSLARRPETAHSEAARDERARQAADFIPSGATVLDLGCGRMPLEGYLRRAATISRAILCGATSGLCFAISTTSPFRHPPGVTHIAALGALETVHDWRGFLRQLRAFELPVVLSYCPAEFTPNVDRRALGWANRLSLQGLCQGFEETGFHLHSSLRPDRTQVLLRIVPGETPVQVRRRVLVMSFNNYGNFGDRLGFHLINSMLPAGAEVHHGRFQPWDVPPGDFDMVVLGIGNSVFQGILPLS